MRMLSLSILTSSILLMPFSASILCGARFGKRVGQDSWLVPPTVLPRGDTAMITDFGPAYPLRVSRKTIAAKFYGAFQVKVGRSGTRRSSWRTIIRL